MRKKTTIWIVLATAVGLFLAALYSGKKNEKKQHGQPDKEEIVAANSANTERNRVPHSINAKGKKRMATSFRKGDHIDPSMYEDDEEGSPPIMTEEQMAQYVAMSDVVAPHFLNNAPSAFDEILAEQRLNEAWRKIRATALSQLLENPELKGTTLEDIQCYELLCKITVTNRDERAQELFVDKLMDNPILFGPGHLFNNPKDDGNIESNMYIGKVGEDQKILSTVVTRLYENMTTESASSIVPTQKQIDRAVTYLEETVSDERAN